MFCLSKSWIYSILVTDSVSTFQVTSASHALYVSLLMKVERRKTGVKLHCQKSSFGIAESTGNWMEFHSC